MVGVSVGITRVVEMPTGEADQHHLAVGIVAVVESFAKVGAQGPLGGDFADCDDAVDLLVRLEGPAREQAKSFDC